MEEVYDPAWDAAQAAPRPGGLAGVGVQFKNILADTEGLFGFSIGKGTNAILNVQAPARSGGLIRNLVLTLTYQGQGTPEVITYDQSYVYERTLPEGVAITLATSGGQYQPTSQVFQIPAGTIQTVLVQLQFLQAFALSSRSIWA